jgi:hypothetical protein
VTAALLRYITKDLKSCSGNSMDCQLIFSFKKHPNGRVQLSLCSRQLAYLYCIPERTHDPLAPQIVRVIVPKAGIVRLNSPLLAKKRDFALVFFIFCNSDL